MSAIEVESLLAPVSAEAPEGADVEFDPAYFELERLAQGTPESVMGDETKPAEEPEWGDAKKAALGLFTRTRDLRVAMILAAAALRTDGLSGFRDGTALVRGFIERLWDNFYPKLDPSDNNDPTIRINLLRGFDGDGSAADLYKFKIGLREAILTNSKQKIGRFSFRDIQIAKGDVAAPPPPKDNPNYKPPEMPLINAAFEDTATEDLQANHAALKEALEQVEGVDAALGEKVGGGVGPDMTALKEMITSIKGVLEEHLAKRGIVEGGGGDAGVPSEMPADEGGGEAVTTRVAVPQGLSGEINSRADVLKALDKICTYYEKSEPASPVPIFIKRAKRLVNMNFVDAIKDLAPDAMSKIEVFVGEAPAEPA